MNIDITNPTTWPIVSSIWRHKNGNTYVILAYTNVESDRQEEYPTTVVYQNVKTKKMYSRRLIDWERSMTEIG